MRSRPEEYLIKTRVGKRERQWLWHSDEAAELDVPGGWKMRADKSRILIFNGTGQHTRDAFFIETERFKTKANVVFKLPSIRSHARSRDLVVEIKQLRPPRPVYTNNPTLEALHTRAPRQICAFYGQRYFLVHYRPVKPTSEIFNNGDKIFTYKKLDAGGFELHAQVPDVHITVGGHRSPVRLGQPFRLSDVDFFRATIYSDVH